MQKKISTSFAAVDLGANMSSFSSGLPNRLWLRLDTGLPLLIFSGTAAETVAVAAPLEDQKIVNTKGKITVYMYGALCCL